MFEHLSILDLFCVYLSLFSLILEKDGRTLSTLCSLTPSSLCLELSVVAPFYKVVKVCLERLLTFRSLSIWTYRCLGVPLFEIVCLKTFRTFTSSSSPSLSVCLSGTRWPLFHFALRLYLFCCLLFLNCPVFELPFVPSLPLLSSPPTPRGSCRSRSSSRSSSRSWTER